MARMDRAQVGKGNINRERGIRGRREVNEDNVKKARQELMDKIPLSEHLSKMGVQLSGTSGKTLCPVHDENTPSFFYDDGKKSCNCFGCGVKGGVVEIHMHIRRKDLGRYSILQSIRDLSRTYKIEIPDLYGESEVPERLGGHIQLRKRGSGISEKRLETRVEKQIDRMLKKYRVSPNKEVRRELAYLVNDYTLGIIEVGEMYKKLQKLSQKQKQEALEHYKKEKAGD